MITGELDFRDRTADQIRGAVARTLQDLKFSKWARWSGDHVSFPERFRSEVWGGVRLSWEIDIVGTTVKVASSRRYPIVRFFNRLNFNLGGVERRWRESTFGEIHPGDTRELWALLYAGVLAPLLILFYPVGEEEGRWVPDADAFDIRPRPIVLVRHRTAILLAALFTAVVLVLAIFIA